MCKRKIAKRMNERSKRKKDTVLAPVVLDVRKTRCNETGKHTIVVLIKRGREIISKFVGKNLELLEKVPDGLDLTEIKNLLQSARRAYKIGERVLI